MILSSDRILKSFKIVSLRKLFERKLSRNPKRKIYLTCLENLKFEAKPEYTVLSILENINLI